MQIKSGHKTFDKQSKDDFIGHGNVWGNVQLSGFIRSEMETVCNGYNYFQRGELRAFDLKLFGNLPKVVGECLKSYTKDKTAVLYEFRHWISRGKKFVHAYIITDEHQNVSNIFVNSSGRKSMDVANAVVNHVGKGKGVFNFF